MVVVDGNGVSIGLEVESTQLHTIRLADLTLQTIRVSQKRERPQMCPRALVADKAYASAAFRYKLWQCGITPTIQTFARRHL
ncbi:MAG: IS5 family transposase [Chloroflexi bacterium AL-W]|nr:IS5 family transposase [Chloroflexi bacterium AL-N1]NOK67296.1 IS5 family transposase [Chloroflexi bacterium AL-N10]NOK75210.1 IS5 family transposase [Chloroflexi bacterium AL-N5]NOK81998.1 IS5 family transposase [Chloroflexi bacterium AL-W]NOK89843.1 IS5 family transposase [Chloroflexi bacterium AL-N15]